jgi:hypothetical protein
MSDRDEWGQDPSVQVMRKLFQAIERDQQELLKRLDITPIDQRLGKWRQQTRVLFEHCWGVADQLNITMDEQLAATVYCSLLAKIMEVSGIVIPDDIIPSDEDIVRLMQVVLP